MRKKLVIGIVIMFAIVLSACNVVKPYKYVTVPVEGYEDAKIQVRVKFTRAFKKSGGLKER